MGPSGPGKTSFSFALAGVFGIDIYVISLQDASVTEEDLAILFARLPRRCIVLLEDIDTVGLRRNDEDSEDENDGKSNEKINEKDKSKDKSGEEKEIKTNVEVATNGKTNTKTKDKASKVQESDEDSDSEDSGDNHKARNKKKAKKRNENSKGNKVVSLKGVSLSGLLNAIDRVASHERRNFIMTTNKPESLDDALVRPNGWTDKSHLLTPPAHRLESFSIECMRYHHAGRPKKSKGYCLLPQYQNWTVSLCRMQR